MLPSASGRIKLNRTLPRKLDEAPLKKRRRSPASVIIPTVLDAKSSDNLNGLYAPLGTRDGACDRIKNAGGSGLKNVLDSSCDHSEDQGASACVELKGTGGSESKSVLCSSCDHSKDQGASACSVQWEPLDSGKSNNGASCGLLRKNDASVESKPDSHPAEAAAAKDVSTQAEEYCKGTPLPINTDTDLQDQPHGGDLCHARVEVSELVQEAVSCRRAMTRSGQVSLNGVPWEKRTGIKKGTFSPSSLEPVKEDSEGESPPKEIQQNLKSESDVVHNGQNDEVLPVIEDKPLVNSAGGTDSVNVSEVTRKKKRRRTRLTVVSRQRKKVPSPAAAHLDQEERLHDFSVFLDRQKCNAMFVESSPSGKESSVKGGKRQIVGVSTSEVQGRVSRKRGQQMRSEIRKLLGQDQKRHTQSSPCMLHTRNESFAAEKRTFTMTLRTSRIGNAASSVTKPKHQAKIPSSGELHDKRLIKSPCCRTCSVPKYVTPRINTPGRGPSLKIKAESKGLKIKQKSVVTPQEEIKKSSQSKAFGIEKYPILKLCDIVKGSNIPIDVTSYKCVLPVELKTKNIKCFKIEGRDLICLKTEAQSTPCSVYSNALKKNSLVPRTRTQEIPEMVNGVLSESRFKTYDIPTQSDTGVAVCEKQNVKKTNLSCGRTIKPIGPLGINDEKDLEKSSGTLETATPAPVLTAFKIETLSLLREIQVKDALSNLAENLQSCVTDDGVKSKGDLEMSILGNLHAAQNTASTENCTVDTKPADTGGAFNRQQSYSCQRTTPYVIHTSISCARAYLPWPFVKCESSEVDCHLTCTQVLPSEDSELSGKKTENLNLSVSSPILNGSSETENSLHPSIECKEEVFTEDSSSSNASDSDMQPQTTEESVVQDSGSLLVTPVKQEGVPTICSLAIVNSPDKVKKERILQGCGLGEKAHLSACEDGKSFSETQPHRMSLKRCSSAELEEGDTNTCPVKRSLTIEPETSELCTVETKSFNPVSPCHPEKLPSASQQVKIPRTSLTFTEYLSSCQDASSADVSSSSSEDDDGLAAFAADFTAEIMCEIEDGCSSSNQRVLHHASSTSDGEASGDVMDVVKAYEQDAIVLDVIQDDPDLFGNLGEVTESVGKPSCTTKRLKKCGHSPVKTSRTVSNCKISLDGSVRCDARLGDLRNCIQRCTTPHTKDECDGMTTCNDNSMSVNTDNPVDASFHVDGGSLNRKGLAEHTSGEENKCLLRTREGSRLGEAGASFGQGFQATLPTESTFSTGSANPYIESRDNDCKTGSKQTEDSSQQGKPWSITRRLGLVSSFRLYSPAVQKDFI
ncbi:uncharacterized protein LOC136714088 [Amia ocellicauda]|uniref:uncharacterized protein LOC136714088 n=1 Tax=Amia ocellicauda TaxID=2972642 RepID=UPI003463E0AF